MRKNGKTARSAGLATARAAAVVLAAAAVLASSACASGGSNGSAASDAAGSSPAASASGLTTPTGAGSATAAQTSPTGSPGSASPSTSGRSPATGPSGAAAASGSTTAAQPATARPTGLPAPGTGWDYQIGGAYPPPPRVGAVSRDSSAAPAPGVYSICYLNGFQAQPDATSWWRSNHPDLLLHASDGSLVVDQNWNEVLLDVSTAAKRTALAAVEGPWIDACAHKGFQAVEIDNLDSYSRSTGLLTLDDDAAFAALLATRAHRDGVAIAQKNTAELLGRARAIGFDLAVTEQCGEYGECGQFAAVYGGHVFDVEYDASGLAAACRGWGSRISIVERDVDVSPRGDAKYVFNTCG